MCVGFTNGYKDFSACEVERALSWMTRGSAVSFDRIGMYHFGIFMGFTVEPSGCKVPLICHFSGKIGDMCVRLDDLRDVVEGSTIRVYNCSCSRYKRSQVMRDSLKAVGDCGYNLATNNCEHLVRQIINGNGGRVSYQSWATVFLPFFQLPRLAVGSALRGASSSSGSSSCHMSCRGVCANRNRLREWKQRQGLFALKDPVGDLLVIDKGKPWCFTVNPLPRKVPH